MYSFEATIRTPQGTVVKTIVQAKTRGQARDLAHAQYGSENVIVVAERKS